MFIVLMIIHKADLKTQLLLNLMALKYKDVVSLQRIERPHELHVRMVKKVSISRIHPLN